MNEAVLTQLRAAVGAPNVLTEGDLTPWEQDWRKRTRGKALAVVRPGSTDEVAAVVRACAATGTPIVPQGGNTGLVVGGVPDASGREVVLSLTRMNKVRAIDRDNLTITVDAGCVLQNLQQAADDAGLLFFLLQQRHRIRHTLGLGHDNHDNLADRLETRLANSNARAAAEPAGDLLFWPQAEFDSLLGQWPALAEAYGATWDEHRARLAQARDRGGIAVGNVLLPDARCGGGCRTADVEQVLD